MGIVGKNINDAKEDETNSTSEMVTNEEVTEPKTLEDSNGPLFENKFTGRLFMLFAIGMPTVVPFVYVLVAKSSGYDSMQPAVISIVVVQCLALTYAYIVYQQMKN